MHSERPVVCLGILVADLIGGPVHRLPERGSLVLVEEMGLYLGGCAANTALALARLGVPVSLVGKVGADALGGFVIEELAASGVSTDAIRPDPSIGTSATMVMIDPDGERRFVHYIGASASLTAGDVDPDLVTGASILHVAGSLVLPGLDGQPTADLLHRAHDAGVVTFLDTAWDAGGRWLSVLAPALPYVDYFVPSLVEAQAMTGLKHPVDVGRALLDRGAGTVALKMGASGCLVMRLGQEAMAIPAYEVPVVDATGAGDAFAAGFIAGVYHNFTLTDSARLANAVGALCVTEHGAAGGVASLELTQEFMRTAALRPPELDLARNMI
jgi:sugar/nucleoside kinase (ribokinase family)